MNFDLFLIDTTVGDVGTGSEGVQLKQNLVNYFRNMDTTFSLCTMKLTVFC